MWKEKTGEEILKDIDNVINLLDKKSSIDYRINKRKEELEFIEKHPEIFGIVRI